MMATLADGWVEHVYTPFTLTLAKLLSIIIPGELRPAPFAPTIGWTVLFLLLLATVMCVSVTLHVCNSVYMVLIGQSHPCTARWVLGAASCHLLKTVINSVSLLLTKNEAVSGCCLTTASWPVAAFKGCLQVGVFCVSWAFAGLTPCG